MFLEEDELRGFVEVVEAGLVEGYELASRGVKGRRLTILCLCGVQ